MAKITHYEMEDGTIVRETKQYGKVTRVEVTREQMEMHEAGSNLFGCFGVIAGLFIMYWLFKIIAVIIFV